MRWPVIILVVLLLAGAGKPAAVQPDPLAQIRTLCAAAGHDGRWLAPGELKAALTAVVTEAAPAKVHEVVSSVGDRAYCFGLSISEPGQPPLILLGQITGPINGGAVLWQESGTWQVGANADIGLHPRILRITKAWGGREVILVDDGHGSGAFGRVIVLRRVNSTWATAFTTDQVSHFQAFAPDDDHILVTGRGGYGGQPLAWTGNCCLPDNHEWLYRRNEPGFFLAAEREIPDPYATISTFVGALRSDQPEFVAYWLSQVATPAAVKAARDVGLDRPSISPALTHDPALQEIFQVEARHWSVLPPAVNGPPPVRRTITVLVAPPAAEITLERQAGGWRVVAVRAT